VNANGDLTVDLRSNIAAESRAKIVYEYLMQFTDDPLVKESLGFLMTREITHMQVFSAALATIQPNFPPGVLQGDPRYLHLYANLSNGASARGPWNEGQGPWSDGGQWEYDEDPVNTVRRTRGLTNVQASRAGSDKVDELNKKMSDIRKREISEVLPDGENQWSDYPQTTLASPKLKKAS
jgi:Mn-containing catalase